MEGESGDRETMEKAVRKVWAASSLGEGSASLRQIAVLTSQALGLRIHRSTVYRWASSGLLPTWKVGGRRLVRLARLLEFARRVDAGGFEK